MGSLRKNIMRCMNRRVECAQSAATEIQGEYFVQVLYLLYS